MNVGERLKIARRTAELSQRDLAKAAGVSAMAISKYERGLDIPGSDVLLRLAHALDVKTEYFLRPITVTLTAPSYRRRTSLPRKKEYAILGQIQEWLERYLESPGCDQADAWWDLALCYAGLENKQEQRPMSGYLPPVEPSYPFLLFLINFFRFLSSLESL